MFFRNLTLIAFCLGLPVVQSAVGTLISTYPITPNVVLPIVMFLGVVPGVPLLRGGALSFLFGALFDQFCGTPLGLGTCVLVATYMLCRIAVHQLFLRGTAFQVGITFVVAALAGGGMLALRAIFGPPQAFAPVLGPGGIWTPLFEGNAPPPSIGNMTEFLTTVLGSALLTAALSPLILGTLRRIETSPRGRTEAPQ